MYEQIAMYFTIYLLCMLLIVFIFDMYKLAKNFIFDEVIDYDSSLLVKLMNHLFGKATDQDLFIVLGLYFIAIVIIFISGFAWAVILPAIVIIGILIFLRSMVRKMKSSINNSIKKHEERLHD